MRSRRTRADSSSSCSCSGRRARASSRSRSSSDRSRVSNSGRKRGTSRSPIVALTSSWVLIQTVFAFHYARRYYSDEKHAPTQEGGLAFPGDAAPDYLDFAYYSFVSGMTSQVSDVQVLSARMRQADAGARRAGVHLQHRRAGAQHQHHRERDRFVTKPRASARLAYARDRASAGRGSTRRRLPRTDRGTRNSRPRRARRD